MKVTQSAAWKRAKLACASGVLLATLAACTAGQPGNPTPSVLGTQQPPGQPPPQPAPPTPGY
ncbi:MAG: hypothetical protein E6H84_14620 [Chloroflexi bacterium]|nr:MAG: hypothetical protein E6H84_14620 [Chloroflexota bacterium]